MAEKAIALPFSIDSYGKVASTQQLSLLTLENVTVTVNEYTNVLSVNVIYALPNNETVSTVVGLVLVDGANPIYQELL